MRSLRSTAVPLTVTAIVLTGCSAASSATGTTSSTASTASAPTSSASSSSSSSASDATPAIVSAAQAFLATLSDDQRDAVQFDWSDSAQKTRWSNLPQGLYQRAGLMWGDLSDAQRTAWLAVMKATLSAEGYQRVLAEQAGDDALAASGGGAGQIGSQYYWVALIGSPSTTTAWQWQWGGHHVTVNATIKGSDLSLTPSFIGVQPAQYDSNGTTVEPLGDIQDEAYAFLSSLDDTQKKAAVLGSTSIDLVLGPGQDGKTIASEGVAGSALTDDQKAKLLALVDEYGGLANDEDAAARKAQLEKDLDQTYFAWYGPTTDDGTAYFRVTGPHVVIEYSPQAMGGNSALHIHGIYRDPTNDYGAAFVQ